MRREQAIFPLPEASYGMSHVTLHNYTPGAARETASPKLAKSLQTSTPVDTSRGYPKGLERHDKGFRHTIRARMAALIGWSP
jgi:hypothetical protein